MLIIYDIQQNTPNPKAQSPFAPDSPLAVAMYDCAFRLHYDIIAKPQ